ncbi:putative GMC oxidoreductase [Hypoxylon sp. NC0597]|nr:putative GMC oxidoreductase [Hypoxylon sp. NC0597]
MALDSYDFIIVGGGTAGLTLASRLSEDPNLNILVLEAGSDHSNDPRVKTPAFYASLFKTDLDWDLQTEPQQSLNSRRINLNQGKALGGSSAINAQVFAPPTRKVIDSWASLGNAGWDWDGFGHYYTKVYTSPEIPESMERNLGVDGWNGKSHNGKGPIELYFPGNPLHPIRKAWVETFKNMGYPMSGDPWVDPSLGVGAFSNLASIDGVRKERSYAANAYYKPIKDRKNLRVLTNATAEKVLFQEQSMTATGVQYLYEGKTNTATARKEVILAAGALQTPKLLELSGIGHAELLHGHGIEVIKHLESVGENLQDHIVCDLVLEAVDGLETLDALQEPEVLKQAMEDFATNHTGLLTSCGITTYAYMPVPKYNSEEGRQSVKQLLHQNKPTEHPSDQAQSRALAYHEIAEKTLLDPEAPSAAYLSTIGQNPIAPNPDTGKPSPPIPGRYVCLVAILAQPLSRGSVHIASKDVSKDPIIDPKYLTNPVDLEVLAEHVLFLRTFATSAPLKDLLKQPLRLVPPSASFTELDAAKSYIRSRAISMWHPAGTCAMLPEDKGGVVDAELKVYGMNKLRIVDASVVPLLPPGNLQSTVYALAEKAADMIKKEYGMG